MICPEMVCIDKNYFGLFWLIHVNVQFVFLEFVTWSSTDKSASNWGLPLTNPQSMHGFLYKIHIRSQQYLTTSKVQNFHWLMLLKTNPNINPCWWKLTFLLIYTSCPPEMRANPACENTGSVHDKFQQYTKNDQTLLFVLFDGK
jgi:hypothetical protein